MAEPSKPGRGTKIALAEPDRIIIRGQDLCADLIGQQSFAAYFMTLLGIPAEPRLVRLVDATLVAISEHGLVPSVQAARMTLAAAPESLHGAVAAGLLGCGSVILGASESAGQLLGEVLAAAGEADPGPAALQIVTQIRAARRALPGFGHPIHKPEDPRAICLLDLAQELGTAGRHVAALQAIRQAVPQVYGRALPLNVSGAIPAVLLDAGFPPRGLKGIPLIARTASLIAHLLEEQDRPIGFALADAAMAAGPYDGPFPAEKGAA